MSSPAVVSASVAAFNATALELRSPVQVPPGEEFFVTSDDGGRLGYRSLRCAPSGGAFVVHAHLVSATAPDGQPLASGPAQAAALAFGASATQSP